MIKQSCFRLIRWLSAGFFYMAFIISCNEEPAPLPTASFTFTVNKNGEVSFVNNSQNATDYSWDFGDGGPTNTTKNPTYTFVENKTYLVTLVASSAAGEDEVSNSVVISNVSGTITFYNPESFYCGSSILVTIGSKSSSITKIGVFASPSCGEEGYATFELAAGNYSYSASCGTLSWSGEVTVAGGCNVYGFPAGDALFYVKEDLQCGPITVDVSGMTRQITRTVTSGSGCFDINSAMYTLPPGTHSFSASCAGRSWKGSISIGKNSCVRNELTGSTATPGGGGSPGAGGVSGKAVFWTRSDLRCGLITVEVAGYSGTISTYNSSGAPACGSTGSASFNLNIGTWRYTATCGTKSWSGYVAVSENNCTNVELVNANSLTGEVMFWTDTNLGCGAITVTINSTSSSITSYHSNGAPACGATGTANFILNANSTFSYSAKCNGRTWSGTVTPSPGGCLRIKLTSS